VSPRAIDENPPTDEAAPTAESAARAGRRSRPSAAMIASAPSSRRSSTKGAKQATSNTASASNSAPVAAAKELECPRPESIAEPVARARATTIFEQISASPPSTYRRRSPTADGWTLAAKMSGPASTAR
jgi:hypothetical protein